jgi:hypothetical protein
MGMGLTKLLEVDGLSIEEYAMMPQQEIFKRAQMGRLDPSLIGIILNEKAQMAQAAANAKALAQQKPVQSVTENNIQINAQAEAEAEAPQQVAGIEALPIREDMFNETTLAGGGIVAFEDGGSVPRYQNQGVVTLPQRQVDPRFLRAQYLSKGLELPEELMTEDELRKKRFLESTRQPSPAGVFPTLGKFLSDMGTSAEGVMTNYGGFGFYDTPKAGAPATATGATGTPKATTAADLKQLEKQQGSAYMNGPAETPPVAPSRKQTKAAKEEAKEEPTEDIMARRMRMLKEAGVSSDLEKELAENAAARAALGKDREQLRNMSLLEAGLSIMGGASPYALQNLAEAKGAVGSYTKGLRAIKEDEKEYAKIERDLRRADQALKRGDVDKALELEDKAFQRQIQLRGVKAQESAAAKTPGEIQLIERYAKDKGITFSQAYREIAGVKAEPKSRDAAAKEWSSDPYLRRQYPNFEDYYATTRISGGDRGFKVLGKEGS